jgi:hypothetical protein
MRSNNPAEALRLPGRRISPRVVRIAGLRAETYATSVRFCRGLASLTSTGAPGESGRAQRQRTILASGELYPYLHPTAVESLESLSEEYG